MKPIGPLMWEHRLIERMIRAADREARRLAAGGAPDYALMETMVDFIRTYADATHHGKEEDILFKALAAKPLAPEHARVMDELMAEHRWGRDAVKRLVAEAYLARGGDKAASAELARLLAAITDFYPRHIEKEDKHFFFPCLDYLSAEEQAAMLRDFEAFDREMIHRKYRAAVETCEAKD